jgi:hypothetical protein
VEYFTHFLKIPIMDTQKISPREIYSSVPVDQNSSLSCQHQILFGGAANFVEQFFDEKVLGFGGA